MQDAEIFGEMTLSCLEKYLVLFYKIITVKHKTTPGNLNFLSGIA